MHLMQPEDNEIIITLETNFISNNNQRIHNSLSTNKVEIINSKRFRAIKGKSSILKLPVN